MSAPHDEGRCVAAQLVYDLKTATVSEKTFNELVAIMRDGPTGKPLTPEAQWRRAYHKAMFHRRLSACSPTYSAESQ